MVEIVNNQRKIKISREAFQSFAEQIIQVIPQAANRTFTIAFVPDKKMCQLNNEFRAKDKTTDVLSFPFEADEFSTENTLGDIVISAEQASRQAAENNLNFETEIKQLILHGVLHLCGYDHETDSGEMNRLELEYRDKLGVN